MKTRPIDQLIEDAKHDPFLRDHVGLIGWGVSRSGGAHNADDRLDRVTSALAGSLRSFDPAKGRFASYFARALHFRRIHAAREFARTKGREETLYDDDHSTPSPSLDRDDGIDVRDSVAALDADDRDIVESYYWLGETQRAIGIRHGVSHETIRQRLLKAIAKLRDRMGAVA